MLTGVSFRKRRSHFQRGIQRLLSGPYLFNAVAEAAQPLHQCVPRREAATRMRVWSSELSLWWGMIAEGGVRRRAGLPACGTYLRDVRACSRAAEAGGAGPAHFLRCGGSQPGSTFCSEIITRPGKRGVRRSLSPRWRRLFCTHPVRPPVGAAGGGTRFGGCIPITRTVELCPSLGWGHRVCSAQVKNE